MSGTFVRSFTAQSSSGSTNSLVIPVGTTIPVGSKVIISTTRAVTVTTVAGAVITDSSGNTWTRDAISNRTSTNDVIVFSCTVTDAIDTSITVTWPDVSSRRAAVVSVWTGIGDAIATSGNTFNAAGSTNGGVNGSSTGPAATATPAAAGLVMGFSTFAGAAVLTASNTFIASIATSAGSTDRGIGQQYRFATNPINQVSSWTLSASQGWSAAAVVYEELEESETSNSAVIIGGQKKNIASMSVIIGGQKKTVTGRYVIVGGQKRPL